MLNILLTTALRINQMLIKMLISMLILASNVSTSLKTHLIHKQNFFSYTENVSVTYIKLRSEV